MRMIKSKINNWCIRFNNACNGIVTKKQSGGKEIIIEMLLAAVVIALALAWKSGISGVVTNMINSFSAKITNIMG